MQNRTPTRNLAFDLVRVTEAAALAAGRQMGRAIRTWLTRWQWTRCVSCSTPSKCGESSSSEKEKDEAPMLFNGEVLGTGEGPEVDIAVDPIEGTRPLAFGLWNSIATVALAPRGTMFDPGPFVYMNKIAVGEVAKNCVDIDAPVKDNLIKVAKCKGVKVEDLTVVILDRPRHGQLIRTSAQLALASG